MKLSELVRNSVEEKMAQLEDAKEEKDLKTEILETKTENEKLKTIIREKDLVIKQLMDELDNAASKSFVDEGQDYRKMDVRLMNILKEANRPLYPKEIEDMLGLDTNSVASLKALSNQLQYLVELEFVEYTRGRWRWIYDE